MPLACETGSGGVAEEAEKMESIRSSWSSAKKNLWILLSK